MLTLGHCNLPRALQCTQKLSCKALTLGSAWELGIAQSGLSCSHAFIINSYVLLLDLGMARPTYNLCKIIRRECCGRRRSAGDRLRSVSSGEYGMSLKAVGCVRIIMLMHVQDEKWAKADGAKILEGMGRKVEWVLFHIHGSAVLGEVAGGCHSSFEWQE